jgi:hypothetical protein
VRLTKATSEASAAPREGGGAAGRRAAARELTILSGGGSASRGNATAACPHGSTSARSKPIAAAWVHARADTPPFSRVRAASPVSGVSRHVP